MTSFLRYGDIFILTTAIFKNGGNKCHRSQVIVYLKSESPEIYIGIPQLLLCMPYLLRYRDIELGSHLKKWLSPRYVQFLKFPPSRILKPYLYITQINSQTLSSTKCLRAYRAGPVGIFQYSEFLPSVWCYAHLWKCSHLKLQLSVCRQHHPSTCRTEEAVVAKVPAWAFSLHVHSPFGPCMTCCAALAPRRSHSTHRSHRPDWFICRPITPKKFMAMWSPPRLVLGYKFVLVFCYRPLQLH